MGSYCAEKASLTNSLNKAEEENNDEVGLYALMLCTSQVFPSVLNAAIDLNLFEILAKGITPLSASQIASQLPIQQQHSELPNKLERMLRLLASNSLVTCSSRTNEDGSIERTYGLSAVGKYFVSNETRGCAASTTTFFNYPLVSRLWANFKEVIVNEGNDLFQKVNGMSLYQGTERDPKLNYIFNKAMGESGTLMMNRIVEVYKGFEGLSTLVDVGGSTGENLYSIISKYPTIKGINFDLPQVVEKAPAYQGIQHVEGDMFTCVPQGDAIILKFVLHNWSDEQCIKLLKNCRKALPQGGKVIVIELILPEASESNASKLVTTMDNVMFITNGGKERSEKEYKAFCNLSGFSRFQVACLAFSALGVIEFHK